MGIPLCLASSAVPLTELLNMEQRLTRATLSAFELGRLSSQAIQVLRALRNIDRDQAQEVNPKWLVLCDTGLTNLDLTASWARCVNLKALEPHKRCFFGAPPPPSSLSRKRAAIDILGFRKRPLPQGPPQQQTA